MRTKSTTLSPHSQKVLALLQKARKPLSAYAILDKLRTDGLKAPPTVYRALDTLVERGLAHRITSLGAYIACHAHGGDHGAQFAVCRACGKVEEMHDKKLRDYVQRVSRKLKFLVEREMLEVLGLCQQCQRKQG